jgi:pimeloyl-ACP methyl ester carboxylesterase
MIIGSKNFEIVFHCCAESGRFFFMFHYLIGFVTGSTIGALEWKDCSTQEVALSCASLQVPLNYSEPNGPQITIALNRYAAKKSIGSVLLNPGGPGASGLDFVTRVAKSYAAVLDEKLDLIGFDPRGIGQSNALKCSPALVDTMGFQFELATIGKLTNSSEHNSIVDAYSKAFAENCARFGGPILSHMSTWHVAQDMDRIRQALGERTMRYWGFSYGSFLGSVYANVFPDKATNIVIDGILSPLVYSGHTFDYIRRFNSGALVTLKRLCELCDKAGDGCPLQQRGKSCYNRIIDLARALKSKPVVYVGKNVPLVITKDLYLSAVHTMLYNSLNYNLLARSILALEKGDGSLVAHFVNPLIDQPGGRCSAENAFSSGPQLGVSCSDTDSSILNIDVSSAIGVDEISFAPDIQFTPVPYWTTGWL